MTERDNTIGSKVKELTVTKEKLENELNSLPAYKTTLRVGATNLREKKNKVEVYNAFREIYQEINCMDEFEKLFGKLPDTRVFGFDKDDWMHDFGVLSKRADLSAKLKTVNEAISKLDKFLSQEAKEQIAFDNLLQDISEI